MVYSVLDLARAEQQLVLPLETFDDPERCKYLLNCPNGTLNLKSGELKAAERTDYISKVCATAYDPTAKCPQWEAFLIQTFGGNQELIDFARRSLGYTLTGSTAERCIFILYGKGANGKSTFLETFRSVLGPDFAVRATTSLFVQTRFEPSVTNDLARLKGARYVIVSESESGSRIKTSLIKDITSVEKITARFLREENFEFTSEAKVFWGTNHKPSLSADDQAIWDRLVLIPFTNTVPPAKRDKDLIERLKAEAQGILAWAVRGAVEYFEFGLNKPREVVDATSAYREELDSVSHFLNAWCKVAQEPKTTLDAEFDIQPPVDPHSSLEFAAGELFLYYEKFCEVEGYKPHRIKDFKAALEARGFQQGPRKRGGKFWQGIIVLPIIKEEYAQRLPR